MSRIQSRQMDNSQGHEHRQTATQFIADVSAYFSTHSSIQFYSLNTAISACEQRISMVVTRSLLGNLEPSVVGLQAKPTTDRSSCRTVYRQPDIGFLAPIVSAVIRH